MSFAIVFPGQGAQSVGMLAGLAEGSPEVEQTFREASEVLDADLWQLSQSGPEEQLNRTEWTQPALLAAGIAVWRIWASRKGPEPVALAGHSLGEYTALVAAGALDFADAVRLVHFRGQVMQEAVPEGEGAMAAILGLEDEQVIALCRDAAGDQVVEAVNFNSPGQVVIAGHREAIDRAIEAASEAGAKRAMPLPVSVPSHCRLMEPAARRMGEALRETEIREPQWPVIHNCDLGAHAAPDAIRDALVAQLHNPVRWVETIGVLRERGAESLVECGPGKVLTGLNRRIERRMPAHPVQDEASLEKALGALAG